MLERLHGDDQIADGARHGVEGRVAEVDPVPETGSATRPACMRDFLPAEADARDAGASGLCEPDRAETDAAASVMSSTTAPGSSVARRATERPSSIS